jgi:hypothetical protein
MDEANPSELRSSIKKYNKEIGQRPPQSTRHMFKTLRGTKWTLNKWFLKDGKTQKNYASQAEPPHKYLKNKSTDIQKSFF